MKYLSHKNRFCLITDVSVDIKTGFWRHRVVTYSTAPRLMQVCYNLSILEQMRPNSWILVHSHPLNTTNTKNKHNLMYFYLKCQTGSLAKTQKSTNKWTVFIILTKLPHIYCETKCELYFFRYFVYLISVIIWFIRKCNIHHEYHDIVGIQKKKS